MAVTLGPIKKTLLSKIDPQVDTRETYLVTGNFTKLGTDAQVVVNTGLSSIESYNCMGNVVSKPFYAETITGGSITFNDGGTAANTSGSYQIIGRK